MPAYSSWQKYEVMIYCNQIREQMEKPMKKKKKIRQKLILLAIQILVPVVLLAVMLLVGWRIIMGPAGETKPAETTEPPTTAEPTTEPTTEPATVPPTEPVFDLPPNLYGPNDFQYYGDYLKCISGNSVMGIDVSRYQGEIDWEKVRSAGVEFAIIRVGGRSYGPDAEFYDDINAQKNYEGAKAAGIKVGAYFFAQAVNVTEAREEAAWVLQKLRGWELDMPVVYDWEYVSSQARTANVGITTLTNCTREFCQAMEAAGYEPMVYFNPTHMRGRVDLEELTEFKFWLAMYSERMTYPYRIHMWQYTDQGVIPGIEGPVDINLYFPDVE